MISQMEKRLGLSKVKVGRHFDVAARTHTSITQFTCARPSTHPVQDKRGSTRATLGKDLEYLLNYREDVGEAQGQPADLVQFVLQHHRNASPVCWLCRPRRRGERRERGDQQRW